MGDLVQLVSPVALTLTLCMFLAGMPSCIQIAKLRSVGNVPFLPFIMTEVNSLLWFSYGLLTSNWTLIICNAVGFSLQALYIVIYITFAKPKTKTLQQTWAAFIFLLGAYVYLTRFVDSSETMISHLGLLGSSLTLMMYGSPLLEVMEVVRTGDTSCISLIMTTAQMMSASAWFLLGVLLNDGFIFGPNIPGIISGLARFLCLYIYRGAKSDIKVD
ncbi:sugar transporter SWEET1-like [Amphiura filiformis]|uniref:sugar transporter SWEET1-like n=1 Tax=Amphiura filiformis TaxID=82378 RepID=UPI003B213342